MAFGAGAGCFSIADQSAVHMKPAEHAPSLAPSSGEHGQPGPGDIELQAFWLLSIASFASTTYTVCYRKHSDLD